MQGKASYSVLSESVGELHVTKENKSRIEEHFTIFDIFSHFRFVAFVLCFLSSEGRRDCLNFCVRSF